MKIVFLTLRTCFVLLIYLLVGGFFYTSTEDGWSGVDAVYFCFVTMSTVGYGDFSPSTPGS